MFFKKKSQESSLPAEPTNPTPETTVESGEKLSDSMFGAKGAPAVAIDFGFSDMSAPSFEDPPEAEVPITGSLDDVPQAEAVAVSPLDLSIPPPPAALEEEPVVADYNLPETNTPSSFSHEVATETTLPTVEEDDGFGMSAAFTEETEPLAWDQPAAVEEPNQVSESPSSQGNFVWDAPVAEEPSETTETWGDTTTVGSKQDDWFATSGETAETSDGFAESFQEAGSTSWEQSVAEASSTNFSGDYAPNSQETPKWFEPPEETEAFNEEDALMAPGFEADDTSFNLVDKTPASTISSFSEESEEKTSSEEDDWFISPDAEVAELPLEKPETTGSETTSFDSTTEELTATSNENAAAESVVAKQPETPQEAMDDWFSTTSIESEEAAAKPVPSNDMMEFVKQTEPPELANNEPSTTVEWFEAADTRLELANTLPEEETASWSDFSQETEEDFDTLSAPGFEVDSPGQSDTSKSAPVVDFFGPEPPVKALERKTGFTQPNEEAVVSLPTFAETLEARAEQPVPEPTVPTDEVSDALASSWETLDAVEQIDPTLNSEADASWLSTTTESSSVAASSLEDKVVDNDEFWGTPTLDAEPQAASQANEEYELRAWQSPVEPGEAFDSVAAPSFDDPVTHDDFLYSDEEAVKSVNGLIEETESSENALVSTTEPSQSDWDSLWDESPVNSTDEVETNFSPIVSRAWVDSPLNTNSEANYETGETSFVQEGVTSWDDLPEPDKTWPQDWERADSNSGVRQASTVNATNKLSSSGDTLTLDAFRLDALKVLASTELNEHCALYYVSAGSNDVLILQQGSRFDVIHWFESPCLKPGSDFQVEPEAQNSQQMLYRVTAGNWQRYLSVSSDGVQLMSPQQVIS